MGKIILVLVIIIIAALSISGYFFLVNYYYPKLIFSTEIDTESCNDPDGSSLSFKAVTKYSNPGSNGVIEDYCEFYGVNIGGKKIDQQKGLIREGICKDNKFINEYWTCGWGKICRDGACIAGDKSLPICTDSDNGKNINIRGSISGYGGVGTDSCYTYIKGPEIDGTMNDECSGSNCYVWEYYCADKSSKTYEILPCPSGCENGACK